MVLLEQQRRSLTYLDELIQALKFSICALSSVIKDQGSFSSKRRSTRGSTTSRSHGTRTLTSTTERSISSIPHGTRAACSMSTPSPPSSHSTEMSVKMFLMWNSEMTIDGSGDVSTSLLEASNLIVLRGSSVIHSNANLGVHWQGLLNLTRKGDIIEAQRLILSLFYSVNVASLGSIYQQGLKYSTIGDFDTHEVF